MKDLGKVEKELEEMMVTTHGIIQHYGMFSATMVEQIEQEIRVEQARIKDIRERYESGEKSEELAEEYADALERISDLNGELQRAGRSHRRAQEYLGTGER